MLSFISRICSSFCSVLIRIQAFVVLMVRSFLYWLYSGQRLLSQKGLFRDFPQRHRVTRLRISYGMSSNDVIGMPPRTQSGPIVLINGSSIKAMDGSKVGSIGFRSHYRRQPDGQMGNPRLLR
jgi:hypothetical protein